MCNRFASSVAAQEAEIARLDRLSRRRTLGSDESAALAELLRREACRRRQRRRRLPGLRERAEARLSGLLELLGLGARA